jgi:energy-coupling factor transporter ATP-binding protein EcfA2
MQRTDLCASNEHQGKQREEPRLMSLCPKDISPMINGCPVEEESHLFQHWQTMVQNFAPILHEGGIPSVFISHAWHLNDRGLPIHQESTIEEARYYDQIDLHLANILKSAGFDVHYDKDLMKSQGITDEGVMPFMEKKVRESDVIIGVCTPLYHIRSTLPSGVKTEVDLIKDRMSKSATVGFYIPLLVHALDKSYNSPELLVGQDHERMNQVIYLDGRDKSTFISNMWRLLHRLWKPVKLKWEDNPKYDPQTSQLNQRYIKALGDLLQIEDYYDHTGQPIPSGIKEGLKNDYSNLRILTTISQDLSANTVATLIKQEIETHQELFHTSRDQHIVAFLGNTGTGKSTLINFLAGRELRADEYGQGYELVLPEDSIAMKIGSGADSETVYPQSTQVGDLLFFDLPGFNDTSGSIRDLVNSAFIRQILIEATSVRFVFVVGQDEITVHRSKIVKKLFNGVKVAFKSPAVIENNSMLIVTKSNFQDCSKAINFWLKKMRSAYGTELQDQLSAWNEKRRLFHMPHSSFVDQQLDIRESMLNGIRQMNPATQTEMQGFNISGFFPPEINMPLQNMFLYSNFYLNWL